MLLTGRLDDGRSFAAVRASPGPAIFVARERAREGLAAVEAAVGPLGAAPEDWTDMPGAELSRLCLAPGHRARQSEPSRRRGFPWRE